MTALAVVGRPPRGVARRRLQAVVEGARAALGVPRAELTVRFAGDATLRRYNRRWRGVDRATDVLSFPAGGPGEPLGDLLISRDRARVQARRAGLTLRREVEELVLHGLLHLLGYDHETDRGEMDALELELRERVLDAAAPARRRRAGPPASAPPRRGRR